MRRLHRERVREDARRHNRSPSWALHEHANLSARDAAVLFSIQDRPVLEALGLYREEGSADNYGHQAPVVRASGWRGGRMSDPG